MGGRGGGGSGVCGEGGGGGGNLELISSYIEHKQLPVQFQGFHTQCTVQTS